VRALFLPVFTALACLGAADAQTAQPGISGLLGGKQATGELHPILTPEFQAQTDRDTDTRLTAGNRLELLENGSVAFPRKLELLAAATGTIRFSSMGAKRDETGTAFSDALIAAVGRGVEVRCIIDGRLSTPTFRSKLRKGGVEVAVFNKVLKRDRKHRWHAKILVIDDDTAIVGGMNMSDEFNLGDGENEHFKDSDVQVEGDGARAAAIRFDELWRDLTDKAPLEVAAPAPVPADAPPEGLARFVVQQGDLGETKIRDYYARCFAVAQDRIVWHVNNINPHGPAFEALQAAVGRGVRVVCITRSELATQRMAGKWIGKAWYRTMSKKLEVFVEAGIEVWEMDVGVHSKALVVDGVMASVGSYNLGSAKSDENLESTYVMHDPALIASVEAMLARDLARAQRVEKR